ncbi:MULTISPECIES: DndE family protein [Rhizobium]|uniref:DndE family protein n=1 Tax=Rhizobium aouanii TaxID=3118145 RepID=A0ABU8CL70_9HYPH|nr:DndE family protein [Rhizobium acaciae]MCW1410793.1 DndE family protein [Rhizobium acaciae]MCW1742908.1 DndE family protein [Rhizobium acaciae]MCW1750104.1 DndE family protein [Rhizobium acaciae]
MSTVRYPLQLGDIVRADFRTSLPADHENSRFQREWGFAFRYQPARLAISASLSDPTPPSTHIEAYGKPIKGDTLFGQDESDLAAWIALIVEHSGEDELSRREFQDLVAQHWARGLDMLERKLNKVEGGIVGVVENLLATHP